MTMRYTHIGIGDQAKAVANLPAPKLAEKPTSPDAKRKDLALQMRCKFCSADSHPLTFAGTDDEVHKRENPFRSKGYVASCRQLAVTGTMAEAGIEPARPLPDTGF